jgi:VanZ family protein
MNNLLQNSKLFRLLFWVWGLTIFILSSLPNIPTQEINVWNEPWRLDYVEHFAVFAFWGVLYIIWQTPKNGSFELKKHFLPIFLTVLFAGADEIHQIWIPGRAFNPLDLIYNILGLMASFAIFPRVLKKLLGSKINN